MNFWQIVLNKIKEGHKLYLLTVIDNHGSSPGRKGFKMLVANDGFIHGSIGGGIMEYNIIEEVKKLMANGEQSIVFKKQVHRGHKQDGSGMICSGEQTIVFHPLLNKHTDVVQKIIHCYVLNEEGFLKLSPNEFLFSNQPETTEIKSSIDWNYSEKLGFMKRLYIIGGGHVSMAVSNLFATLGFYVIVLDNRDGVNTVELNESAHQKKVIDFNDVDKFIVPSSNTYVAIMTNTFIEDQLVLDKLLRVDLKYLGILGSKAKLEILWNNLRKKGYSDSELNKVHGPIGMSIKSETPEEIAVSIAAEVISIANYE